MIRRFQVPAAATARRLVTVATRKTCDILRRILAFRNAHIVHRKAAHYAGPCGSTHVTWYTLRGETNRSRRPHMTKEKKTGKRKINSKSEKVGGREVRSDKRSKRVREKSHREREREQMRERGNEKK